MKSKLKVNNPVSAGTRHKVSLCKLESSLQPYKKLIKGKISSGGRNNTGRITMRRLGGGHKQCYRMVDTLGKYGEFSESKYLSTEYDPTRTGNINRYYTKKFNTFYVLGSEEISDVIQGSKVIENNNFKAGNVLPLKNIPVGFEIYNIQNHKSNKKTNFCKSAGCKSILLKLQDGKALVKLPSKAQLLLDWDCIATIGSVNNSGHSLKVLGKAGVNRWLGKRPKVRGYAMNPFDHPNGGKTRGGQQPKTKWGKVAKWVSTRKGGKRLS